MQKRLRIIVLHTLKYNDSSLIVHAFTEQEGRMSFWLRIPKSRKSLVKNTMFQPLSLLELEVTIPARGGLCYIKEAKAIHPFSSIPYNPVKLSIALFLAEFLYYVLKEEAENRSLFAYLSNSVEWLDGAEKGIANFHLVFLLRFSRFLGLYPNTESYHAGDYFDLLNGCFVGKHPFHGQVISAQESASIGILMRMNYDTMRLFSFSHNERNRFLDILLSYYSIHIPGFPEMKSLSVLKELFE